MAMESTIALAVAMGRTLVMPPQKKMYLLGKADKRQKHHFSFVDFFPIEEMAQDNQAFNVVSMKEYLETEGLTGHLVNKVSEFEGIHTFIPRNGRVLFYYYLNCGTGHSNFSRILLCLFLDVP
jgi:hypothetical protein